MISIKRKTLIRFARLFVAIIIILGIKIFSEMWQEGAFITVNTQHPKRTVGIVIDIEQREKFFEQLKRFARAHDFDIHIGQTTPAGDKFNINISGREITLIANNAFDPRAYDISFYDKHPANPVPDEEIDILLLDLKRFISEVPNIRIFEKQ